MSEKITATYNEYSMDALVVEYSDTADLNIIDRVHEEPLRRALNARHKERKAAKKAERRFYATSAPARASWQVRDRGSDPDHVIAEYYGEDEEADARAFAKFKNNQLRKRAMS